jgi:hypothetical protein
MRQLGHSAIGLPLRGGSDYHRDPLARGVRFHFQVSFFSAHSLATRQKTVAVVAIHHADELGKTGGGSPMERGAVTPPSGVMNARPFV